MSDPIPIVTVVICTYGRAALVRRAIRSAQEQTYSNIEIVVVDDASPDETRTVIEGIPDKRIRYIRHESNKGVSASRNTGIRAAKGEYVAFLDDDDEWKPSKLERQVSYLQANGCDAVLCASLMSGNRIRRHRGLRVELDDLRRGNEFMPGSGLLAKTSAMVGTLFDEAIRYGEDWDVLIRLAQRHSIGYLAEPLYRIDEGGHHRATNSGCNLAVVELERRMVVIMKHERFFGPFWFKHHIAMAYLLHFRHRTRKLRHLTYIILRCGAVPVMSVVYTKILRKIKAATAPRSS